MFALSPLPRTLEAALRDVHDKKVPVRRSALADLQRYATEPEARAELRRVLHQDAAPVVRREVAAAMGATGLKEFTEALLRATTDPALEVRQMAVLALGEVRAEGPQVVRALEKFLDSEGPAFRFQSLLALSQIAPAIARPHLMKALRDDDVEVSYLAVRLLEENWLSASPINDDVLAAVQKQAAHSSPRVRLAVGLALVRWVPEVGAKLLAEILNARYKIVDPEDEQSAIELSGELSISAALPGLRRRAFPPLFMPKGPFAWHATASLARLGDAQAKAVIFRGLRAFFRDQRNLAVAAAGAARLAEARPLLEGLSGKPRVVDPVTLEEALAQLGSYPTINPPLP
ncbi:MAG: HEAT repeat domain-containing protein [Polyangiaceae bacterium]|nr:HEAT repeat domain-containing protein [Polyangiaceae bacterium]